MVAYDALMQQCVTAHCARKAAAMLTHETSELTSRPNGISNICCKVLWCYFTYLHESNLKLRLVHILRTSVTVNITKVVKILQGNAL